MVERALAGAAVLVTGASGFLGSHLCRELVRLGATVHGLRREASQTKGNPEVSWHRGDLTDAESLRRVVETVRPTLVYHLAAYGTTYDQGGHELAFRTNVEGAWNLWRSLEGWPCRLVNAGSCGEYGEARGAVREDHVCRPEWFYPATKNAAVVLLSTLGREEADSGGPREVVTLRPFGPYGPGDDPRRVLPHSITTLLLGKELHVTLGEQLRDYAYVEDHVAAFVAAGTRPLPTPGAIYNIGSGRAVTLRHALELIAQAVGGDAPSRIRFGAVPYRPREIREMCCDIGAARTDLGYAPRVTLEDGIARTVAWFRERE